MNLLRAMVALQGATFIVVGALLWRTEPRLAAAQFLLAVITILLYA